MCLKKSNLLVLFICLCLPLLSSAQEAFKMIAYYVPRTPIEEIPFDYITHLNYSFAIPAKSGDTLEPLKNDARLKELIPVAHKNGVKVFISIGGWSVGDGGGEDGRFHRMAETKEGRSRFINSTMKMVNKYGFDGVDLDWEYPDENHPSADHFVELSRDLYNRLHAENKQLTAAVVSAGKKAYGIKEDVYPFMDWINIMAYDGDYGPDIVVAHSPYSLALKCLNFWLDERNLPAEKCVLGLPFYAKKGMGRFGYSYKKLLQEGASPYDDYWQGHYYNGMLTIEAKTNLSLQKHCAGVMVWELSHDTSDEFSLFKTIYQTVKNSNQ